MKRNESSALVVLTMSVPQISGALVIGEAGPHMLQELSPYRRCPLCDIDWSH